MSAGKRELLEAEDRAWRELIKRFDALGDRWEQPGAAGEWCAKDVLAHVACWHAEVAGWLERWRSHGERPGRVDFEKYNEDFHQRCSEMTLHEVQAMSGAARHRLREEVALLEDPTPDGWVRAISTTTFGHYDEHIPELDAFLETA